MKSAIYKLISIALCMAMAFNLAISASAAPSRNTGNVKFLSDVALIEASSETEANEILAKLKTAENGGFEGMIALDLNNGGKTKVYLAYKSSTNVDDAITDIAVMNMNGDYTMGNYEQLLEKTLNEYIAVAKDYRTMALEFKENYDAGTFNARTAYRQMNYYYVEENGTKTYMGDYLLNFPEDVTGFAKMLFNGNLNILTNLRSLMSMAIGDKNTTLAERIATKYEEAKTNDSIYNNAEYEDVAVALRDQLVEMKERLNTLPLEIETTENNTELDEEIKNDLVNATQESLNMSTAFLELLKEISMGDTTLGDYVMNSAVIETQKLFPIVAAATEAEALMMGYNSFYTLLLYDVLEKGEAALSEILAEFEKDYEPISVYYGVQNELTTGTVGVTGNAELVSASSGKSFISGQNSDTDYHSLKSIGFTVLGSGGVASMLGGAIYLGVKKAAITANYNALKATADSALRTFERNQDLLTRAIESYSKEAFGPSWMAGPIKPERVQLADYIWSDKINDLSQQVTSSAKELDLANQTLSSATTKLSGAQIAIGSFTIVLGAVMMGVSIWQLIELNNKYEVNYTDIPNNMVDVVSNDDFGDRFINYKNVPSYYLNDGKLSNRENDLNGYNGVQWVSMYYTKNYEAGYCLTTTADLIAKESVRSGYSSIHLFGHSSNYNLNSYCNREGAEEVYLSFKYSTKEKSAVTEVPSIIGTAFNTGVIAISAFAGFGLGMGVMAITKKGKKKSKKSSEETVEA